MQGNLPPRLTSFLGRGGELSQLGLLIRQDALITLTGPGGSGKTSMAVELARTLQAEFADGAWFVGLDGLADPGDVAPTTATALGLLDVSGVAAIDRLAEFLRTRSLLLVLDNFEHVLGAAPAVSRLIEEAPGLRLVITSRTPLHLAAEREVPVGPLRLPDRADDPSRLTDSDAVRLFVERARLARPSFNLSPDNGLAVVDVCRRLDGLPLGIELAASRIRYFSPAMISERLAEHVDLPGPGVRDLPERQQNLERVVAWSYDLLEPPARRLLERMSVFAGGCAFEEAEAVCDATYSDRDTLIEGIAGLIDQNLLISADGPSDTRRLRMLETIRAFGRHRLSDSGELAETRRRHALAYRALAEAAAPNMPGRMMRSWLERLGVDHDNLRLAVRWAVEEGETETALRLGGALWRFWQIGGHVLEGRASLAAILELSAGEPPTLPLVWSLAGAGGLAWWANDVDAADAFYAAQLDAAESIRNKPGMADALFNRAWTQFALADGGDMAAAEQLLNAATDIYEDLADERGLARTVNVRAFIMFMRGSLTEAIEPLIETHRKLTQLDDDFHADIAADSLSAVSLALGDLDAALDWGGRSLRSEWAMGNVTATTAALPGVVPVLAGLGLFAEAATVDGAYDALCGRYGMRAPIRVDQMVAGAEARARVADNLTPRQIAQARALGSSMSLGDVVDYVVEISEGRRQPGDAAATVDRNLVAPSAQLGQLMREGDYWTIVFGDRTFRMRDAKGLRYLAQLLTMPGREVPAIDLASGPGRAPLPSGQQHDGELSATAREGDEVLDAYARAEYRSRLLDLHSDIEEAEQFGDLERATKLRVEFDFLTHELAAATGLGGRSRRSAFGAERARIAVTKAIHSSIERIAQNDSSLGDHMRRYVHTGRMCSYSPDPALGISWTVAQ